MDDNFIQTATAPVARSSVVSVTEAQKLLKVPFRKVREMYKDGKIAAFKTIHKTWLYSKNDVMKFV